MQQIYHSNAKTNINNRCLIKNSTASNKELCERFGVSEPTIIKWKSRVNFTDKSSAPIRIAYALSAVEKAVIISARTSTWMPLDDVLEVAQQSNPSITRSSVYRLLLAENINDVPQEQKLKANKFKEYKPGYLHIDVTYLPKFDGQKYYLFVAIDRATRTLFYQIYESKTAKNTEDFVNKCTSFFPFSITHILTDNGLEFTNKLLVSKKGENKAKDSFGRPSALDVFCAEQNIEHRLTKPATPKTNGMVERVNGTIKNNTILKDDYADLSEMNIKMLEFLTYYLLYRRHSGLVKESGGEPLKIKTPIQAIEKWFLIEPQLFKDNPETFKQKITNLTTLFSQVITKQPCET
jgi:transposase InsO family protein